MALLPRYVHIFSNIKIGHSEQPLLKWFASIKNKRKQRFLIINIYYHFIRWTKYVTQERSTKMRRKDCHNKYSRSNKSSWKLLPLQISRKVYKYPIEIVVLECRELLATDRYIMSAYSCSSMKEILALFFYRPTTFVFL